MHSPETSDNPESGEKLNNRPPVEVYVLRHGKEDKSTGELTEEGIEVTQEAVRQIADKSLEDGKPTVFFVLASPTRRKQLGQRAMHTGRVAVEAIKGFAEEKGLSPDSARVHIFGDKEEETRPTKSLSVPTYSFDSKVEEHIIHELNDDWDQAEESFLNMDDPKMEELIAEAGEANAAEEADRAMKLLRVVNRYSRMYDTANPDVRQVYIMTTHGDLLRAMVQHGLGAGEKASGYVFSNSEPVHISLSEGKATAEFNGGEYEAELGRK